MFEIGVASGVTAPGQSWEQSFEEEDKEHVCLYFFCELATILKSQHSAALHPSKFVVIQKETRCCPEHFTSKKCAKFY